MRRFAASFKGRLYLLVVVSLVALGIFAAIALDSIRDGSRQLSHVFQRQVEPMADLRDMEDALKDTRFRLAGYLLEQLPSVGNINQLEPARSEIIDKWAEYKKKTGNNAFSGPERDAIALIDRNLGNIGPVFEKLAQGYRRDDKAALTAIFEDEWPFAIHAALIKPIESLVFHQHAAVGDAYAQSIERGQRRIAVGIAVLTLVVPLLAVFAAYLTTTLTRRLDRATGIANRVAVGDWGGDIDDRSSDEVGQLLRSIAHMRDQVHSRELRLETILNNAAEGIITFDENGTIEGFNLAAERLFGYTEAEVRGKDISLLIPPATSDKRQEYLEHFLRTELQRLIGRESEVTGRHLDGSAFPLAIKISRITLEGRQVYTALAADISERKALVDNLKSMAEHDGLTGLYNRSYFQDQLERAVESAKRSTTINHALLYIDLDHFKYVNDTLGHAAGDRLLIEIAGILSERVRATDVVSRLGGDEFTVLLDNVNTEQSLQAAESFRKKLANYVFTQGSERVDIGCSIGIAAIDARSSSGGEVMSYADHACHLAKRAGRNQVYLFKPDDTRSVTTMSLDMGWSRRIKDALERNLFALTRQPIMHTGSRAIDTYEVLIRMLDENNQIIMPDGFMPAAERFGLSVDIDRWVIVRAIDTLAAQRRTAPQLRYSINLSAPSLANAEVLELIHARLAATGLDPAALTFEVTETVAITDMSVAEAFLSKLRAIGCKTALDDFGSGMASFAYLKELPVDIVKIDGRFVKNLATSPVDQAMVRAMNEIAHALGKQTVAEFVEDEASFLLLAEYGVDFGQGYHLGRPVMIDPTSTDATKALPAA